MKIIKRDLSEVLFDISKIENAIYKAFVSVGDEDKKILSKNLANEVFENILKDKGENAVSYTHLEEDKRYMHQYNFPPFSVGDVRPLRSPGRREIGHGALAERALIPVLPSEDEFPYTMRLVSEVLSSNGSSSQASICGSTLSLLDAGVPIKDSVAGIAMGLRCV